MAARKMKKLINESRQKIKEAQRQGDNATVIRLLKEIEDLSKKIRTASQQPEVMED